MQLRHAARTDVGKTRDHNEDSYGVEAGGERAAAGALFVVCDGIGGYAAGEVASDLAVKTIIAHYYGHVTQRSPAEALESAFHEANRLVFEQGGGKMGTTSVAAVFRDDAMLLANVGDCRAILIRDGKPRQLTRDHSFVAEQVAAGMLTEQQARESSYRNIITRAIGHRPDIEVDLYREPLVQDDILVLCSDGLHGPVETDEIALAVTKVPLDQACAGLIKLANERGGHDNITVVAIKVVELTFSPDQPYGQTEPTGSVAKTARLTPAAAVAPTATGTDKLSAYGPSPAIDRRSPANDRRATVDRRQAPRPVAPPVTPPSGSPIRSFLTWMIGLALLASLIFGAWYVATNLGATQPVPSQPIAAPRTQTPLGGSTITPPQPTLIPTTTTTP